MDYGYPNRIRCMCCIGSGAVFASAAVWWKPWTWGDLKLRQCRLCEGTGQLSIPPRVCPTQPPSIVRLT